MSTDPTLAVADALAALKGTSICELEVDWGEGRVRITRSPAAVALQPRETSPLDRTPSTTVVSSLYVGVYHRADSADLPEVGDTVAEGQILAEIETLTIRNPVVAPCAGVLVQALLEDGMPVEFGQPLFVINAARDPA
jgi:biotin carboxyl carrier protein